MVEILSTTSKAFASFALSLRKFIYSALTSKFLSSLTFISFGSHIDLDTETIYDKRESLTISRRFDTNVSDSLKSNISKIASLYISFFVINPLSSE